MIQRKIKQLGEHVKRQGFLLFRKPRSKGFKKSVFLVAYTNEIQVSVPTVSREDIAIITTGFLGRIRQLSPEDLDKLIRECK